MKVSHFPSFMEGRGKHTQQNTQSSDRGLLSGEREKEEGGIRKRGATIKVHVEMPC
jgi:hypothetical protein